MAFLSFTQSALDRSDLEAAPKPADATGDHHIDDILPKALVVALCVAVYSEPKVSKTSRLLWVTSVAQTSRPTLSFFARFSLIQDELFLIELEGAAWTS
jgi:hypothetical protein